MKTLFRVGVMAVVAGAGCAVIAGPAQADVWQDAVCGHGYHYGKHVNINGQDWKITAENSNGSEYILRDSNDRQVSVRC